MPRCDDDNREKDFLCAYSSTGYASTFGADISNYSAERLVSLE